MPAESELVLLSEPLLDCEAAAELLNVRVSWVRDAARLGHLPCLRVGRHLRFTRAMLEEWLAVQVSATPGRGAGGASERAPGASRPGFRRSTQAALLASLAEAPKGKGGGRNG
ncbi:MAG: helix-turn-helix domain-containing protein [Solirubrobacterales bacterium]|nr:helix-turn-helix domain-containing protein [Solirubrobacterales bacterium]